MRAGPASIISWTRVPLVIVGSAAALEISSESAKESWPDLPVVRQLDHGSRQVLALAAR